METDIKQLESDAAAALNAGELERAAELYQNLLEQDSNSSTALFALGTLAFQEKRYSHALPLLDRAAALEPEAVDIAFNYASCLATVGERLKALLQLQRATQYCRDDAVFVPRIADLSIRLGEPAAAVALLSRLKRLTPNDQIILANAQGMLGNWREAVAVLEYLHKSTPGDAVVAEKLATACGNLRDYAGAIKAFERYLQLVKPSANDYLRFADLLLIAQDSKRCEQALKIAAEMGEDSVQLHLLKARTERLKANYKGVQESLAAALERQANNGQVWSIKAELATEEEAPEFITMLRAELARAEDYEALNDRHKALLQYALADLSDRVGDFQAAAEAYAAANDVQYAVLKKTNLQYSDEAAELQCQQLITHFSADVFTGDVARYDADDKAITPIFIVGMPRSGTTLVERILGQNENVYCAGEQEGMEFVAAHFKQQVNAGRLPAPAEIKSEEWSKLRQMYLQKLPNINKPIFTDKLPHNFRNVGLILKLFPDAKIIQLHRDSNDVALSIYAHAFAPGHNYANRWEDIRHFHSLAEKLMGHWSSLKSTQILDLDYQQLVSNPEVEARKLVEFVGFRWDEGYLDFHKSVSQSFTFSEMQVRQPISDKRIGRWRSYAPFVPELNES